MENVRKNVNELVEVKRTEKIVAVLMSAKLIQMIQDYLDKLPIPKTRSALIRECVLDQVSERM